RPTGREPRQSSHECVEIPRWLPAVVVVVLLPVLEAFVVGFARGGLVGGHDLLVHLLPSVDLSIVHQPVHARQDDAGDLVTAGLLLRRRGPVVQALGFGYGDGDLQLTAHLLGHSSPSSFLTSSTSRSR